MAPQTDVTRPVIHSSDNDRKIFVLRVTNEEYRALTAIAACEGTTLQAIGTSIVADYLAKHSAPAMLALKAKS